MNKPALAESEEFIKLWNEQFKHWRISASKSFDAADPLAKSEEGIEGVFYGDPLLKKAQYLRAKMIPLEDKSWRSREQLYKFQCEWNQFKRDTETVDFTDMIERTLETCEAAPFNAQIGFFDEVQDFTPLELALIRKWTRSMEFVIMVGDDDQCLYSFKGASAEAFLTPEVAEEQKRVLTQSYRVPAAVHEYVTRWIKKLKFRQEKEYAPRKTESGEIVAGSVQYISTDDSSERGRVLVEKICDAIESELAKDKTTMVLATCAYMLRPLINTLRERGIKFHNPYNTKRGDWNPLAKNKSKAALLAFLSGALRSGGSWSENELSELLKLEYWTRDELELWLSAIKTSEFMRNKKLLLQYERPTMKDVQEHFKTDADLLLAANADLNWFLQFVAERDKKKFDYLTAILRRDGSDGLNEKPRCTIGTIHSVKGGEADSVFVLPDYSLATQRELNSELSEHARAALIRLFYVAFTRAKENLFICEATTQMAVKLP